MHVPQAVKDRITQVVFECVTKATKHFGRSYTFPEIRYTVRGKCGGIARGEGIVDFNPILLMENQEQYFKQVVPHEVAHCIDAANGRDARDFDRNWDRFSTGRRSKRSVHGPSWKNIMRVFGCVPDRCHQMDTANAAVRTKTKFEYKCTGCNKSYFVSSVRHNKQRRFALANPGRSFYSCNSCGRPRGALVFVANHGKVSFQQARTAAQATPAVVTKEVPVQQLLPKAAPAVSNAELARRIFAYGGNLSRQDFIAKAAAAGMKSTTASTYYAQLKRS